MLVAITLGVYQNPRSGPTARSACVLIANGRLVRKTGGGLEIIVVTKGGAARTPVTTASRSRDDSRTSKSHTARLNYHPRHRLLRPAIAKIMIPAPLVMMTATTVVALSVQEPLPLPIITFPPVVHEHMVMVVTVGVYQYALAVLKVMSVNEAMGKQRLDPVCHHAGVPSLTDSRPTTAQVNEVRWKKGLMIELRPRTLI